MNSTTKLAEAIAAAAATMPDGHLNVLATRIGTCPNPAAAWAITREPPVAEYTLQATAIVNAWHTEPHTTGPAISLAIRAATNTRTRLRAAQTVDLVWTGPDTRHIRARRTSDVVIQVINSARRDLLLVSYATYPEKRIRVALTEALAGGVNITALIENEHAAEGQYEQANRDPFDGLNLNIYEWATDTRPRVNDRPAVLHAKIVLADDQTAFVTSANLTGRALDHNIEAGILIEGGPIPKTLYDHFRELAVLGVVQPVPHHG